MNAREVQSAVIIDTSFHKTPEGVYLSFSADVPQTSGTIVWLSRNVFDSVKSRAIDVNFHHTKRSSDAIVRVSHNTITNCSTCTYAHGKSVVVHALRNIITDCNQGLSFAGKAVALLEDNVITNAERVLLLVLRLL